MFKYHLPSDVGGAGEYKTFNSQMGFAAVYLERSAGNDDAAGRLAEAQESLDTLIDLLQGWLCERLAKSRASKSCGSSWQGPPQGPAEPATVRMGRHQRSAQLPKATATRAGRK